MSDGLTPLTPAQVIADEAQSAKAGFIKRNLIALDMSLNALTGGRSDETISARSGRAAKRGSKVGVFMVKFLDIFEANHCSKAVCGDLERAKAIESVEDTSGIIPTTE